jgi:hypothetical protein
VRLSHEKPAATPQTKRAQSQAAKPEEEPIVYDLSSVIVTLPNGKRVDLPLPFSAETKDVQLLQTLARYQEVTEQELRQHLGTRRVSGMIARLMERLAREGGPEYEYIKQVGTGAEGSIYRLHTELLE